MLFKSRFKSGIIDASITRTYRRWKRLQVINLTESLEVGYRLSPRGKRLLAHLRKGRKPEA